jgi:N-alpha-acetyl-L-2,4-diaminobutyrate deacetylase
VTDSPVHATIDLDRPGKHYGFLQVPRSTNTAGWSKLFIPIVVISNGTGRTALITGGNHGDEPEGQVAILNFARETGVEDVRGRLIMIPCLSPEASRQFTRLWPSGANFNRSFPGNPEGSANEQLADYLTRVLFPLSDVVLDIHSGGRSSLFLPWAEMHLVANPEQRRRMLDGMLAWNTDWCVAYIDVAGSGLLVSEAERQGKTVLAAELGGGGHATAEMNKLARDGLENVLRHEGLLEGRGLTRAEIGKPPQTVLKATDNDDYLYAPETGLWETMVELGQRIEKGAIVGRIHFIQRPDRAPEPVHARSSGIVCVVRAIASTDQGDNVVVVGHEVTVDELLTA